MPITDGAATSPLSTLATIDVFGFRRRARRIRVSAAGTSSR